MFNLGTCDTCLASNLSKQQLYCHHMVPLLQYIKAKWPNLCVIIWHDMLGSYSVEELQPFANLVEPMAWGYIDNLTNYFPQGMFHRFGQIFDSIWVASSFKGSSGRLDNLSCIWLILAVSYPISLHHYIALGYSKKHMKIVLC